jgi:hypothetical protein
MSSFLIGVALVMVGSSTERAAPEHKTSVCDISHDPVRYLGRRVAVDAVFVDATPHTIYIADPKNDRCILDIGSIAGVDNGDALAYLDMISEETKVRIHAVLESKMRDSPFGRGPYRSYFLDQMKITRLQR